VHAPAEAARPPALSRPTRSSAAARRAGLPVAAPARSTAAAPARSSAAAPVTESARSTAPAPTALRLLGLQRAAGNAAVAQLVAAPAVQRQAADFGLAKSGPTTAFAAVGLAFWRSNPDKTLLELGSHLIAKASDALAMERVPAIIKPTFEAKKERGLFTPKGWTINIDLVQITKKPVTTKLRDLTADEAGDVTDTCFHEARHAEQHFLQARVLAAKDKKDAAAIQAALDIPEPVATAAFDLRMSPPDKAVLPFVEQWNAFDPGGKHADYKKFNNDLMDFVANTIAAQAAPAGLKLGEILTARANLDTTIASWKRDTMPFATTKAAAIKAGRRGPMEVQILSDLAKLQQGFARIERLDAAFGTAEAQLRRTMAAVSSGARRALGDAAIDQIRLDLGNRLMSVVVAIGELGVIAENAYRAYPHEADAHRVGRAVRTAFATAAKKRP
jgi:hypothetical protein